ncbi:MAG: DUF4265 domain-containing protein [Gemmataceae bacterium]
MTHEKHLLLLIEYRHGVPLKEPVHVQDLGGDAFRLLYAPGFIQGLAAGDDFRPMNDDGAFEVLRRGGNLTVQVFASEHASPYQAEFAKRVASVGGTLDGAIERGLSFTVPLSAGFPAIESIFNAWVSEHPGWEWYFGNVYDPIDGITPLGWWNERPQGD